MAVWVDVRTSPGYLYGWACDMGPWIGTWPMLAPGEMSGLDASAGDELDFVIGLDNPAHPGDPYYALDGTYDSQVWDAYRVLQDPGPPDSFDFYSLDSVGAAATPGPTDTPPAGAHLWVVAWNNTVPPNPPEFYVPAEYVAGGAAAFKTVLGAWSDWQDGLDESGTATQVRQAGWSGGSGNTQSVNNTGGNNTSQAGAAITAILAGATFATSGITPAASVSANKVSTPIGDGTTTDVTAFFRTFDFHAYVSNPYPLGSLEFGVDYADEPWFGDDYEFESSDPAAFDWDTLELAVSVPTPDGGYSFTDGVRLMVMSGPVAAGTVGIPGGAGTVADFTSAGTVFQPLPSGLDPDLTVAVAPLFIFNGASGANFPNIAYPPNGGYLWGEDATPNVPVTPTYHWSTSRYRYWLPNPIVPTGVKWHNVAGHYAPAGTAALQINTPGVGWVDIADGLP